ncbi:hypothetical protein KC354_g2462 [Hortaea werneckii]|nr:hypothetical protein KC354_g2462 [Hortaea werneckii]KAI7476194.1 hypothetical protein KC351_g9612 [Hortaea werneckii]
MEATMGDNYYYVTSTGPVFAGQGMNLHGAPQSVTFPAPLQDGDLELAVLFNGPSDDFDCEYAEIGTENGHHESQPLTFQVPGQDMADSDSGISQSFSVDDFSGMEDSQCYLLQDEQNPGATWVEGPPEGALFGNLSGSDMVDLNDISLGPLNSEPEFALPQHQTYVEAGAPQYETYFEPAPQPDFLQIPNRDQRAQRRAQLLAEMQRISQELLELEALDAA